LPIRQEARFAFRGRITVGAIMIGVLLYFGLTTLKEVRSEFLYFQF
jgi:hypothetical protein